MIETLVNDVLLAAIAAKCGCKKYKDSDWLGAIRPLPFLDFTILSRLSYDGAPFSKTANLYDIDFVTRYWDYSFRYTFAVETRGGPTILYPFRIQLSVFRGDPDRMLEDLMLIKLSMPSVI